MYSSNTDTKAHNNRTPANPKYVHNQSKAPTVSLATPLSIRYNRTMSHRLHQVNENIQRELSLILAESIAAEAGLLTIAQVSTSPDLRTAKVWVSVLNNPNPGKVVETLNAQSQEFFHQLSPRIKMKFSPQLTFLLDEHGEELTKLDSLLDEIHNDEA